MAIEEVVRTTFRTSFIVIVGKTTRILYLMGYQLKHPSIYISFQGINCKQNFWSSLGNRIHKESRSLIDKVIQIFI